jgi:uncharacterized protein
MALTVAPFFIGLFAVMVTVGYRRLQTRIAFFDGGDRTLMRAHGNFTETVPISLLAMTGAELTGAPHWLLWSGGVALLAGRLVDLATLVRSERGIGRAIGMILTFVSMGGSHAIRNALAGVKRTGVGRVRTLSWRASRLPVWYSECIDHDVKLDVIGAAGSKPRRLTPPGRHQSTRHREYLGCGSLSSPQVEFRFRPRASPRH